MNFLALATDLAPVGSGRSIVAARPPHECTVLEILRDMGLDRPIIFNKNAVMFLPTGVNQASGLLFVLDAMNMSRPNVVAAGDAENDLPMLAQCECGVAVRNATSASTLKAISPTAALSCADRRAG
jgi:hypothetical protein